MPEKTISQKALVRVESLVRSIRGGRVILDSDLAKIYGVSTKRLNEQVRRNIGRGGRRYIPFAFRSVPQS